MPEMRLGTVILGLVLLAVLASVLLMGTLLTHSADASLNKLLDSQDRTVGAAFATADDVVTARVEEYLDTVTRLSELTILTQMEQHEMNARMVYAAFAPAHGERDGASDDHEEEAAEGGAFGEFYNAQPSTLWRFYDTFSAASACTAVGVATARRETLVYEESSLTVPRAQYEYHHPLVFYNNGSAHDGAAGAPAAARTLLCGVGAGGAPNNLTEWHHPAECPGADEGVRSKGAAPTQCCRAPRDPLAAIWPGVAQLAPGAAGMRWTPPLSSGDGVYMYFVGRLAEADGHGDHEGGHTENHDDGDAHTARELGEADDGEHGEEGDHDDDDHGEGDHEAARDWNGTQGVVFYKIELNSLAYFLHSLQLGGKLDGTHHGEGSPDEGHDEGHGEEGGEGHDGHEGFRSRRAGKALSDEDNHEGDHGDDDDGDHGDDDDGHGDDDDGDHGDDNGRHLGGGVHEHAGHGAEYGRAWCLVRAGTPAARHLTGVSHGDAIALVDPHHLDEGRRALPATEATDGLIRNASRYVEGLGAAGESGWERLVGAADVYHSFILRTARAPQGETMFLKVTRVRNQGGLDWYLALLLDRQTVLGEIDASLAATRAEVSAVDAATRRSLRQERVVTYCVVAGVVLAVLAAAAAVTVQIVTPLGVLRDEMHEIAVMHVEKVTTKRLGWVSEVHAMQESFRLMADNLGYYKEYMPQAVLMDDTDTDADVCATVSRDGSQSLAPETLSVLSMGTHGTAHDSSTHASHGGIAAACKKLTDNAMRRKKVTMAVYNVVGWTAAVEGMGDVALQELITRVYLEMQAAVQNQKGVFDAFFGDRFVVAHNAFTVQAGHKVAAVGAALQASARMRAVCTPAGTPLRLSFAACTGEAKVGPIGCHGMKKVTVLGRVVPLAVALEQLNKQQGWRGVVNRQLAKEAFMDLHLKAVDCVEYSMKGLPEDRSAIVVYEVHGLQTHDDAEWMYQMASSAEDNEFAMWNQAFESASGGQWEAAAAELAQVSAEVMKDPAAQRLAKAVAARKLLIKAP